MNNGEYPGVRLGRFYAFSVCVNTQRRQQLKALARRRVSRAVEELYPDVNIVPVRARSTRKAGGSWRWVADESGRAGCDAFLVVVHYPT